MSQAEIIIATWRSRGGAQWVDLYRYQDGGYGYSSKNSGGSLGVLRDDDEAIEVIEKRAKRGDFQPDKAKLPLERISF